MANPNAVAVAKGNDGLRRYLQQIHNVPMLRAHEELELARRWHRHQDANAAGQLVTSHLRLAATMAFRYRGYGLPLNDLISEGNVGLMQAARRFDPESGFRFASYARWWIRSALQMHILHSWSTVRIATTAPQKRLFFNLRRLESRMQIVQDGDLLPEQVARIASILGVSHQTLVSMHRRLGGPDRSLNAPMSPDGQRTWEDALIDEVDLESEVGRREEMAMQKSMLPTALGTLNRRQRHILFERRLKESPTKLEELASQYGVSAERVRQIENRAFEKLRKSMWRQMSSGSAAANTCGRDGRMAAS